MICFCNMQACLVYLELILIAQYIFQIPTHLHCKAVSDTTQVCDSCVCACMCLCVHACICGGMRLNVCACMCLCVRVCACVCACMCLWLRAYVAQVPASSVATASLISSCMTQQHEQHKLCMHLPDARALHEHSPDITWMPEEHSGDFLFRFMPLYANSVVVWVNKAAPLMCV